MNIPSLVASKTAKNKSRHTCLSSNSLLALRHVTRYLVRPRKEPKTSTVKWSLDERCNMKLMTRNPLFWIMCCWTV